MAYHAASCRGLKSSAPLTSRMSILGSNCNTIYWGHSGDRANQKKPTKNNDNNNNKKTITIKTAKEFKSTNIKLAVL